MRFFPITIEKVVVVNNDETQLRILHELGEVRQALRRLETTLSTDFDKIKAADEEVKTELANLATSVEDLVTRLGDNPTAEEQAAVAEDLKGIAAGLRTVTNTVSTLDQPAPAAPGDGGDTPPAPADPDA